MARRPSLRLNEMSGCTPAGSLRLARLDPLRSMQVSLALAEAPAWMIIRPVNRFGR